MWLPSCISRQGRMGGGGASYSWMVGWLDGWMAVVGRGCIDEEVNWFAMMWVHYDTECNYEES